MFSWNATRTESSVSGQPNSLNMLYKPTRRTEGFGQVHENYIQRGWLLNAFFLELSQRKYHVWCTSRGASSGSTNIITSRMPEHDSWDEGRLPRSGTFVCLVISAQKQLKSVSAGRKARNSLAGARTETANPCCPADIEDRLANLPSCDLFSQTSILWPVWHGWPCWEFELPPEYL